MRCKTAKLLISAYFDNLLDSPEKKGLEAHLETCPGCSAEFAKIDSLINKLKVLAEIDLPVSLSEQLSAKMQTGIYLSLDRSAIRTARFLAVNKGKIYRYAVEVGFVVVLVALVVGLFKYGMLPGTESSRKSITKEKEHASESPSRAGKYTPPVRFTTPPKAKLAEPGVEDLRTTTGGSYGAEQFPQPEVNISHKSYDKEDIEDAMIRPSVRDFSLTYSVKQVPLFQATFVKNIAQQVKQAGEDAGNAEVCISTLLTRFGKPALPVYFEKVRFKGKDAWLLVIMWNDSGPDSPLSKASVFVIDPARNAVMYTQ